MTTKKTGNGNGNSNSKGEMRGFFDCAIHDKTVNGFAQNDSAFLGGGERRSVVD
jgi:hypothetical protein